MPEAGTERRWRVLVWTLAIVLPLVAFRAVVSAPATTLPGGLRVAAPLGDQTTNATAIARAWQRWDRGDFSVVDDRVFAPVPNAIGLGEYYPLPALVGYPVWKLSGSVPLGVNVPYLLAVVLFPCALYAFYARLAGPGPGAAIAALVVAWSPSRMNGVGVLSVLATGFVPLGLVAALRFLDDGRRRDAVAVGFCTLAQCLTSLYGVAMGALWAVPALVLAARPLAGKGRRLAGLAAIVGAALAVGAAASAPYFRVAEEIGPRLAPTRFDQHAADLLSVLHGGLFGGPVRDLLERLVPGFPPGAAAFFPTLTFLFAFGAALLASWISRARMEGPRTPIAPWVVLALAFYVLALGPTIRAAGVRVGPGPYALLTGMPVFSSMRGIHRFDQWFHVSLGAAAALALGRAGVRRGVVAVAAVLAALDAWPAFIPAVPVPSASGWVGHVAPLPRATIVAAYPWDRAVSTQAWVDQLAHGARVANGWFTFAPEIHELLDANLAAFPVPAALMILRELGVEIVVVDEARTPVARLAEFDLVRAPAGELGLTSQERLPGFRILRFRPLPPAVLHSSRMPGLLFRGSEARLAFPGRPFVFRIGPANVPVVVEGATADYRDVLTIPAFSAAPATLSLSRRPPAGAIVRRRGDGTEIGRAEPDASSREGSRP